MAVTAELENIVAEIGLALKELTVNTERRQKEAAVKA